MANNSDRRLCGWLLVAMLLSLTLVDRCRAGSDFPSSSSSSSSSSSASSRSVRSSGSVPFNVQAWLQLLRSQISQLKKAVEGSKRSCNGFPCMYTHLGAKAGKQARMMSLMSILSNCARDPSCSPGKRRRRSATARQVLSMLTQRRTTTS